MARDPLWDTEKLCPHAPRVGAGESGTSPTARSVEGAPGAATAECNGSDLLGRTVEALEELAEFFALGEARDRGAVAPPGFPTLLGMEEPTPTGSAHDQYRAPRFGAADELRQPFVGCTKTPRIHGELLKLGLTVSQATVSKYMLRHRRPPSQGWRAFLKNHAKDLIALDFFTVRRRPSEFCSCSSC